MLERSKEYKRIGEKLIKNLSEFDFIKEHDIKVAYLVSDEVKKKNRKVICADCNKVSERYKWCCKYDFFIVVYEANILEFSQHQKEVLIRHELSHIGVDTEGIAPSFYIVPHDVEDFYKIIEDEGIHWAE